MEFRNGPPRRAFNFPTDSAAPSNVSNCSVIVKSCSTSIPDFFAAIANFLKVAPASFPNAANFGLADLNCSAISAVGMPIPFAREKISL